MGIECYRILAINDNPDNLSEIKAIIKDSFPSSILFTALNGQLGIELARMHYPNVILLDISTSIPDGFETCRVLKNDQSLQHIPLILLLTAQKTECASRVKALESGAEVVLSKPIDEMELAAQVRVMAKIHSMYLRQKEEVLYAAKLADLTKQRSREELATLYNHAPVGLCLFDERLEIRRLNLAAMRMGGNQYINAIGLTCGQWLGCINSSNENGGCGKGPNCEPCSLRQALQNSLLTGQESTRVEARLTLKRGDIPQLYYLLGNCTRISFENSDQVLLCLDDITEIKYAIQERLQMASDLEIAESKAMEAKLLQAEKFEHVGHRNNLHCVLVIDDETLCREMIASALRDFDYEVIEAADGRRGIELAKEKQPDLIICDINMEGLNGYDVLTEIRKDPSTVLIPIILITGDAEHFSLRHGMELGADDYLAKPFSVPELVSAVEARYKKFQAYRQMAEKRVDELCSSISLSLPHELLTPLTGILGIGQVLRDSGQNMSSDQVVELSQLIIDSGNRLHRLINNFLIFTQIELLMAKPNEIDQQAKKITQNTKTLIFETAMSYALSAGRNNDLKLDLHASSAAISEDFLVKIVQELLDNAFKFSKTASTVTLSTRVVDNSFVLSVTDQGIGMPSERISQIGAFMQFDRKILEQQGSGLGLAIIKRFLEIHKGSIEIESVLGQGTTVRIWLAQNMG